MFGLTVFDDQSIDFSGYYAMPVNLISKTEQASAYHPASYSLTLRYKVITPGGSYTVEETLVPKTTPFEVPAAKPYGDMRHIPGDNNTQYSTYSFDKIYDGIWGYGRANGWLTDGTGTSTSFTVDLHQAMKLTRMIMYPNMREVDGDVYGNCNTSKCELWGTAVLDESKLTDPTYWVDAQGDYTGTFKADWEFLGVHEIERLDKRGWPMAQSVSRGSVYGHQFLLPESANPVRYVRLYSRENLASGQIYSNPVEFFMGEISFFGYAP